jgi:hypothetical protein
MALSRHKDQRKLQRKVLDQPKGEHQKHTLWETRIKISINIHRTSLDGDVCRSWVNRVNKTTREEEERHTGRCKVQDAGSEQKAGPGKRVTAEEMPVTTQNKIKGQRVLDREIYVHNTGRPFAWRDKTPEATDPEDLIPEAKTQSKESKDFSWSAQKVEERGISKKVAEGGMGEEEKEQRCDATSLGNKRPSPKCRGFDSKVVLTQITLMKI